MCEEKIPECICQDKMDELKEKYGVDIRIANDINYSVYTDSISVSRAFGKHHVKLINIIEGIQDENPAIAKYFRPRMIQDQHGQDKKVYDISKTGFTELKRYINGAKSDSIYKSYLEAFSEALNIANKEKSKAIQSVQPFVIKEDSIQNNLLEENKRLKAEIADRDIQITVLNNKIQELEKLVSSLLEDPDNDSYENAIDVPANGLLIRDTAKIMNQAFEEARYDYKIGEKKLFRWLINNNYLTNKRHTPTAAASNLGYFTIVIRPVQIGSYKMNKSTTYVTEKGQKFLITKFLDMLGKGTDIDALCQ